MWKRVRTSSARQGQTLLDSDGGHRWCHWPCLHISSEWLFGGWPLKSHPLCCLTWSAAVPLQTCGKASAALSLRLVSWQGWIPRQRPAKGDAAGVKLLTYKFSYTLCLLQSIKETLLSIALHFCHNFKSNDVVYPFNGASAKCLIQNKISYFRTNKWISVWVNQTFKLMEKVCSTSFLQWNSQNLNSIPHLKSLILTSVNMLLILSLFWAHKCRILRPRWKRHPCIIQNLKQINSGGSLFIPSNTT